MAQSRHVFGITDETLTVQGEPEEILASFRDMRWAQLNVAAEDAEPEWVWVNQARVLYVEQSPVGRGPHLIRPPSLTPEAKYPLSSSNRLAGGGMTWAEQIIDRLA